MAKIISLYGLPACGKTTQANKLAPEFGLINFGMGDRLRAEINSGSDLGQKIKKYVEQGTLITDDLMSEIIKNLGNDIKTQGVIFDGFPRMLSQAEMLEKTARELDLEIDAFFYLKVSQDTALKRIKARSEITGRSDDKDLEAVKNRLDVFKNESEKLMAYYKERGKLFEIDGEMEIEDVYNEIKKHL